MLFFPRWIVSNGEKPAISIIRRMQNTQQDFVSSHSSGYRKTLSVLKAPGGEKKSPDTARIQRHDLRETGLAAERRPVTKQQGCPGRQRQWQLKPWHRTRYR